MVLYDLYGFIIFSYACESEMHSCTVSGVAEEDYHYVGSEEWGNSEFHLLSKAESREPRGKHHSRPSALSTHIYYWTVWWMRKSFCKLSGGPSMLQSTVFVQTHFTKPAICNSNTVLSWRRQCNFNSALMVFAGEFKPSAGGSGVRV